MISRNDSEIILFCLSEKIIVANRISDSIIAAIRALYEKSDHDHVTIKEIPEKAVA